MKTVGQFLAAIAWVFIVAVVYALLFLSDPMRAIYLKWLVFVAVLFAPGIWFQARDMRKPKGEK